MLVSASLGVTLFAIGLLLFALVSRGQAVRERGQAIHLQVAATAQALALESQSDLIVDPEASVILGMRAVEEQATPETMVALREAMDGSPLLASLPNVDAALCFGLGPSVAFWPRHDAVTEYACGAGIIIANIERGSEVRVLSHQTYGSPLLTYSPNGSLLAVGTVDGINLLDPESGTIDSQLVMPAEITYYSTPNTITFNPSGSMIGATTGAGRSAAMSRADARLS